MQALPLADMEIRRLYRLRSRNLLLGAWNGEGFVGIRTKFGEQFLDAEDPAEVGGTAWPTEALDDRVPDDIELRLRLGSRDTVTGREVAFDQPVRLGGRGWYFVDDGRASDDIRSAAVSNTALFAWLKGVSGRYLS